AAQGLDPRRAHLAAQSADQHFDGIEVALGAKIVEMFENVALGQNLSGAADEQLQQAELLFGKGNRHAIDLRIARDRIDAHAARLDPLRALPAVAAQQGVQPGQQFLETHRFHHEIIGPGVQPLDLILPTAARGQDQHRAIDPPYAPVTQQIQPAAIGQSEVENDRGNLVQIGPAFAIGA
ncbi:hypothetical protein KXV85_004421, partial [Aspergillus fumigatus]